MTEQSDVLEESVDTEEIQETAEVSEDSTEEVKEQSKTQNAKQRLRRKLRDAEERARLLEEQNKKIEEKFSTLEKKIDSVVNPPASRPSRVDFDTEEDYEDALYDWRNTKSTTETTHVADQGSPKPKTEVPTDDYVSKEIRERWDDQIDTISDKYEDFDDVVSDPSLQISDPMAVAIMESENGGEVAYFLGKNPKEAARISKLSIVAQVREIDKLSAKFKPSTSNAPEPIDAIKGSDVAITDIEKMSPEQYRDYRRKKMAT